MNRCGELVLCVVSHLCCVKHVPMIHRNTYPLQVVHSVVDLVRSVVQALPDPSQLVRLRALIQRLERWKELQISERCELDTE